MKTSAVITALAVALIISLYTLIDGTAVKNGPPLPYALTKITFAVSSMDLLVVYLVNARLGFA